MDGHCLAIQCAMVPACGSTVVGASSLHSTASLYNHVRSHFVEILTFRLFASFPPPNPNQIHINIQIIHALVDSFFSPTTTPTTTTNNSTE